MQRLAAVSPDWVTLYAYRQGCWFCVFFLFHSLLRSFYGSTRAYCCVTTNTSAKNTYEQRPWPGRLSSRSDDNEASVDVGCPWRTATYIRGRCSGTVEIVDWRGCGVSKEVVEEGRVGRVKNYDSIASLIIYCISVAAPRSLTRKSIDYPSFLFLHRPSLSVPS